MDAREIATLLRRMCGALVDRLRGGAAPRRFEPMEPQRFRGAFESLPPGAETQLLSSELIALPVDHAPWFDTGIDLHEGEWLSWFANGEVVLSALLDLRVGAHFQVWARIGDGEVFRGLRNTHSFRAANDGRLYLASYFPGEWATPQGALGTAAQDYRGVRGAIELWLMRWRGDAESGLRAVQGAGDPEGLAGAELKRLAHPHRAPRGWYPLWFLGPSEIYSERNEGCIHCRTFDDVEILQRDVALPLSEGTCLRWDWRVERLPSRLAENSLPTHDYMSIAVEFDNGIDITYYWSAKLPREYGYWCPLPTWKSREFHVVLRSGEQGFGQWLSESRDLFADYRRYISREPPARIVRVWLIAVSLFQRGEGECEYRDIRIEQGSEVTDVHPQATTPAVDATEERR